MDQKPNTRKGKNLAEMLVDSLCGLATEAEMQIVRESLIDEQKILDDMKLKEVSQLKDSLNTEVIQSISLLQNSKNILWVHDHQKNDSMEFDALEGQGWKVFKAVSNDQAIAMIRNKQIQIKIIITYVGRTENGSYNRIAGIELCELVRKQDNNTKILMFSKDILPQEIREQLEVLNCNLVMNINQIVDFISLGS